MTSVNKEDGYFQQGPRGWLGLIEMKTSIMIASGTRRNSFIGFELGMTLRRTVAPVYPTVPEPAGTQK